jgi:hypothetical protein
MTRADILAAVIGGPLFALATFAFLSIGSLVLGG